MITYWTLADAMVAARRMAPIAGQVLYIEEHATWGARTYSIAGERRQGAWIVYAVSSDGILSPVWMTRDEVDEMLMAGRKIA